MMDIAYEKDFLLGIPIWTHQVSMDWNQKKNIEQWGWNVFLWKLSDDFVLEMCDFIAIL